MKWVHSCDPEEETPLCLECLQEDINNKVPDLKRQEHPLPCPKHGHPGTLSPQLREWWKFFVFIAPYSPSQTTLDHQLISKICEAYDVPFILALQRLTWIQRIVNDYHQDHGDEGSQETNAIPFTSD